MRSPSFFVRFSTYERDRCNAARGSEMNKHLAIVEDDPGVRAVLEKCLTGDGYQVTAVPSGAGIKHVLSKNDIALVIVDIGLPDIDGLTLTRRIREEHDVGIIILSGRRELTDRVV